MNAKRLAYAQSERPRPRHRLKELGVGDQRHQSPARRVEAVFGRMRENNVTAVLPEIYDGRHAYFPSRRLPSGPDLLETILPLALAEGLEVHAWMRSMPCLIPEILAKHGLVQRQRPLENPRPTSLLTLTITSS